MLKSYWTCWLFKKLTWKISGYMFYPAFCLLLFWCQFSFQRLCNAIHICPSDVYPRDLGGEPCYSLIFSVFSRLFRIKLNIAWRWVQYYIHSFMESILKFFPSIILPILWLPGAHFCGPLALMPSLCSSLPMTGLALSAYCQVLLWPISPYCQSQGTSESTNAWFCIWVGTDWVSIPGSQTSYQLAASKWWWTGEGDAGAITTGCWAELLNTSKMPSFQLFHRLQWLKQQIQFSKWLLLDGFTGWFAFNPPNKNDCYILHKSKPELREAVSLARGHTADLSWGQDSNSSLCNSRSCSCMAGSVNYHHHHQSYLAFIEY